MARSNAIRTAFRMLEFLPSIIFSLSMVSSTPRGTILDLGSHCLLKRRQSIRTTSSYSVWLTSHQPMRTRRNLVVPNPSSPHAGPHAGWIGCIGDLHLVSPLWTQLRHENHNTTLSFSNICQVATEINLEHIAMHTEQAQDNASV